MMNSNKHFLTLGYDLNVWDNYGIMEPIKVDISPKYSSSMLICGMSGGGKSYLTEQIFYRLVLSERDRNGEYYFANYKNDGFEYYQGCKRYSTYYDTLSMLEAVYNRLQARLSGQDKSRNPITLFYDEYMAAMLQQIATDKRKSTQYMIDS